MKTLELNTTSSDFNALIEELKLEGEILIVDNDLPVAKLVNIKTVDKITLKAGCLKGFVIAADFDEPLEEFKDYIE